MSPNETSEPVERPGGDRGDFGRRELALVKRLQHFAPDRPGGADDRDPIAHSLALR